MPVRTAGVCCQYQRGGEEGVSNPRQKNWGWRRPSLSLDI